MTELAKRILIVRPDEIGTEAAREYDQAGWDVVLLPDLASARPRCESPYDLALVAARLPDGEGLELVARLAGVPTWLWAEGEDSLRLLAAGAAGLIEEGLPQLESQNTPADAWSRSYHTGRSPCASSGAACWRRTS